MPSSTDPHIPTSEFYRLLLNHLPNIAVLTFDRGLHSLTAQGAFLRAIGFTNDYFVGKTLSEIFSDDLDVLLSGYQAALSGEINEFEATWQHHICRMRVIPVRNDQDEIFAGMMIVEDITTQRHSEKVFQQSEAESRILVENTEEKLRESEAQLQLLFENSQDSIVLADREAKIFRANPAACKMFGRTEEELRTLVTLADLLDLSDTRYLSLFQTVLQTGHGRGELTARRRNGTPFPIESSSTMLNRDPNATQSWTIMRDISDMKRYHEALVESERLITALEKENELNQLKSRMMERVAHEFRTPFSIITLTVELITKYLDRLDPTQVKERVTTIYAQIQRLSDMLDEIDLGLRGQLIPQKLQPVSVDLTLLCREITLELETQFAGAGRYSLDLIESAHIVGDPNVLRLIFLHLLRNAARFSPSSSPVKVHLALQSDTIKFSVTDNGIGILENEQSHIFDSFFRGSNVGEIRGLGLGLTIVRDCVAACHGSIYINSVPNQGTTIQISLPLLSYPESGFVPDTAV